jgi:hypothetical protein
MIEKWTFEQYENDRPKLTDSDKSSTLTSSVKRSDSDYTFQVPISWIPFSEKNVCPKTQPTKIVS